MGFWVKLGEMQIHVKFLVDSANSYISKPISTINNKKFQPKPYAYDESQICMKKPQILVQSIHATHKSLKKSFILLFPHGIEDLHKIWKTMTKIEGWNWNFNKPLGDPMEVEA